MGREARAKQPTDAVEIGPWLFSVPISKVDKETRLVSGIVTSEVLDKQGDIVDYDAAKKVFSDETLWPGNMREMHQPKAVGKRYDVSFDDTNKEITLTARVSKGAPDTWEKVLDGTLSMYSIGGTGKRVAEKTASGVAKRLYLDQLAEVSFVDNGACPTAKFEIVKSVDGQLADAQPDEPADEDLQDPVAKAVAALDDATKAAAAPTVDYAGPDQTIPIVTVDDARKAMAGIATIVGAAGRLAVRDAVVKIATAKGADFVAAITPVAKGCPEPYDIDRALASISMLESLMANEYWDARYSQPAGVAPDPVKVAQIGMLKSAIDATLQFLVSEHQEQFSADPGDPNAIVFVTDDATVEMFMKSLDVVQKSGARHSKSDVDMIQKVHDLSGSLGANCHMDDEAAKVAKAAAAAAPVEKKADDPPVVPAAESSDVQKLTADLETTKAALTESQAVVAKQAETIAAFDDRLKTIEGQPATGGPVRSAAAVDKALGGPSADGDQASSAQVVKALQDIAASAPDDATRSVLAKEIVKFQSRTGSNRMEFSPTR